MDPAVRYQKLYVVSDLHLGGEPGFQIFSQGNELAALIEHVTDLPAADKVALVLNGDIVDFLAERNARYLDPEGALEKLERIFRDPAFARVWASLAKLVKKDGRELVVVLGNHDVELALPALRERLLLELCGGDAAARGRVRFSLDGAGFACTVGGRKVLCTHGNEVDDFNVVDFRQLLEFQRAANRGQPYPAWVPNAGTKLVIDVMNDVKAKFPFVDLLKPETTFVPAVVFALDPDAARRVAALAPVVARLVTDMARLKAGLLGGEEPARPSPPSEAAALQQVLAGAFSHAASSQVDVQDLLANAETALMNNVRPDDARAEGSGTGETLGLWGLAADRILNRDTMENLREALLRWLGSDRTFAVDQEDPTFVDLDRSTSPHVDFIVAGHTHLERAIKRRNGRGMYFNSGTWIRLIQLTEAMLATRESFAPVYDALRAGTMAALDAAAPGGVPLVLQRPIVVEIEETATGASGRLAYVRPGIAGGPLQTVPRSERSV